MIVDLEEKTECGWFDLEGGGRLQLRLLSIDDIREMRKQCVKTIPEYPKIDGEYRRFEGTEFNTDLWREIMWDKTIMSWEQVFDKNEIPIPVTRENKVLLMTRVAKFNKAYEDGLKALKESDAKKAATLEKN